MASSSYQAKHLSNKATSCSFHGWHPFFRENARMAWRPAKQREDARQTACSPKSCKPLNEPPLWYQMERHRRQINIRQHQIEPRSSNRTLRVIESSRVVLVVGRLSPAAAGTSHHSRQEEQRHFKQ
jgi:hypothetical protein